MIRQYKPVEERHRFLTALEKYWDKHPSDNFSQLYGRLTEVEEIRDETALRKMNKEIR